MFCQYCGAMMQDGQQFCPSCGRPQQSGAPAPATLGADYTPPAGIKAQTGKWIGAGWEVVKADLLIWVAMTIVFVILNGMVPLILQGPLTAGFQLAVMRKMTQGRVEFADLFQGFNFFVPTLVASLLITVFTSLGALACLIGALVVSAMFMFSYLFIVDRRMEFWPAMQASHAVVKQDYFGFSLFVLTQVLVNILGVLVCLVGVLVTLPLTWIAVVAAYRDTVGFASESRQS